MSSSAGLRSVLRSRDFRALFATRLTSQSSDGLFQVALASLFFFSPERAATADQIALAFATLLLPYSLAGPFAGVLLDRWRRRQVLVGANAVRAAMVVAVAGLVLAGPPGPLLYAAVLGCVSINRFFLAGLSASLPHVIDRAELVMANTVVATSGTAAAVVGGAAGFGLRRLLPAGAAGDACLLLVAAAVYALAALLATRMHRDLLGPDLDPLAPRASLGGVGRGFAEALAHVVARRPAAHALAAIGSHRFFYGVSTVIAILLYRNHFNDPADVEAGLAGLAGVFAASGLGFVTAAFLTPPATARTGTSRWITVCLLVSAVVEAAFVLRVDQALLVVGAYVVGVAAQSSKICVDTIVQRSVDDAYRGRVFSFYDVVFNVAFVAAAAFAALVVPPSGLSRPLYALIALGYAATALAYAAATRRALAPAPR